MNSTGQKSKANFLRVVGTPRPDEAVSKDIFVRKGWQSTFFANENPWLVLFINFDSITESDFQASIEGARPRYLIDLRRVPRFDLGKLNRRQAFALFAGSKVQYLDLSGRIERSDKLDAGRLLKLALDYTHEVFLTGPIAFLVDAAQFDEASVGAIIEALPSAKPATWDVLRLPVAQGETSEKLANRTLVFISHANPQDNDFAAWLAGQLTLAGYTVWSDVTKLLGGEILWDDIETAIREQAAKVVVVLSKDAQNKAGVLDEIDLAVRVERSSGLNRFVVPIRIDDLSFADVRANIARKLIIDFKDNWASGLYTLLSVLERDQIPRQHAKAEAISEWVSERFSEFSKIVPTPETLTTNWLPILSLPPEITFYDLSAPNTQIDSLIDRISSPRFRHLRLVASFASGTALEQELSSEVKFTPQYRVPTGSFIDGAQRDPLLPRKEARKALSNLLRQAWNQKMSGKGLRPFQTASGGLAWYLPNNLIDKNRSYFTDESGKRRYKALVGWSERRKVFWHFAVEARPTVSEQLRFTLRPHVIFTPDGAAPVESKERMHVLRRRFCKSWWNDRWRDLLIAYVSWLSSEGELTLPAGGEANIALARGLLTIASPVSILEQATPFAPLESLDEVDELDAIDEFDTFEDDVSEPEVYSDVGQ